MAMLIFFFKKRRKTSISIINKSLPLENRADNVSSRLLLAPAPYPFPCAKITLSFVWWMGASTLQQVCTSSRGLMLNIDPINPRINSVPCLPRHPLSLLRWPLTWSWGRAWAWSSWESERRPTSHTFNQRRQPWSGSVWSHLHETFVHIGTDLAGEPILLHTPEIEQIVKVQAGKFSLAKDLMTEFPSAFHYCTKHLVIATPGKKNLPRIQFEKCAPHRPDIYPKVVRHSKDYHYNQQHPSKSKKGHQKGKGENLEKLHLLISGAR